MSSKRIYETKEPENKFYVYLYLDPDTRDPFYVGKGSGKRSMQHLKAAYWDSIKKKTRRHRKIQKIHKEGKQPIVIIAYDNLPEDVAFIHEASLVAHYGRLDLGTGCLTNMSDGGEGNAGYRTFVDKTLYTIYHQDGRILKDLNRMQLRDVFGGNHQTTASFLRVGYAMGWATSKENIPEKLHVQKDTEYELYHIPTGKIHKITKINCADHGITVDGFLELVRKKKSVKIRGDYCRVEYSDEFKLISEDHTFRNVKTGEVITTSPFEMKRMYGLQYYQVTRLVSGEHKMLVGWEYVGKEKGLYSPFFHSCLLCYVIPKVFITLL